MSLKIPAIIILCFVTLFPIFWWLIMNLLGKMAGMEKNIDRSVLGTLIKETGYGSARINSINYNGCIKILFFENGFLLKVMPIFGGFEKWIPKGSCTINNRGGLFGRSTVIQSDRVKISLYGKLRDEWALTGAPSQNP